MAGQMNFGRTDGMTGHIAGSQLTALNIARRISLFRPKAEQTMENMLTMTIVDPDIITEQIIQGAQPSIRTLSAFTSPLLFRTPST